MDPGSGNCFPARFGWLQFVRCASVQQNDSGTMPVQSYMSTAFHAVVRRDSQANQICSWPASVAAAAGRKLTGEWRADLCNLQACSCLLEGLLLLLLPCLAAGTTCCTKTQLI